MDRPPDYASMLGFGVCEPPTARCSHCGNTYVCVPGAKTTECCGCRKKKRLAEATERRPRELAPNAFKSQTQLDRWYNNDWLRCHVCGQEVSGLQYHVRFVHHMSPKEYRLLCNIPVTYGLLGKARRKAMQVSALRTVELMGRQGFPNLEKARSRKTGRRLRLTSFQEQERTRKMIESEAHPSKREGYVMLVCTKRGAPVEMPASVAALHQCNARCERCNPRKKVRQRYR